MVFIEVGTSRWSGNLLVKFSGQAILSRWGPVVDVFCHECEPLVDFPGIHQVSLVIEELLDVILQLDWNELSSSARFDRGHLVVPSIIWVFPNPAQHTWASSDG